MTASSSGCTPLFLKAAVRGRHAVAWFEEPGSTVHSRNDNSNRGNWGADLRPSPCAQRAVGNLYCPDLQTPPAPEPQVNGTTLFAMVPFLISLWMVSSSGSSPCKAYIGRK